MPLHKPTGAGHAWRTLCQGMYRTLRDKTLRGQKLFKKAENVPFWRVFEKLELAVKQCCQIDQF